MKPLIKFSFKKWGNKLAILLLLMCSQVLSACGSDSTASAIPQNAATATSQIAVTTAPKITVTPTSVPATTSIGVANRRLYNPIPTAQIPQAKQEWLQLLEQSEQKWKTKNVTTYQIVISYHNTPWPPGEQYTLTVKNGQVMQNLYSLVECQSCGDKTLPTPDPAKRTYKNDVAFTVPGLFELVRSLINQWNYEDKLLGIEFDANYGFPKKFILENYHYTDNGIYWKVDSFKELP